MREKKKNNNSHLSSQRYFCILISACVSEKSDKDVISLEFRELTVWYVSREAHQHFSDKFRRERANSRVAHITINQAFPFAIFRKRSPDMRDPETRDTSLRLCEPNNQDPSIRAEALMRFLRTPATQERSGYRFFSDSSP